MSAMPKMKIGMAKMYVSKLSFLFRSAYSIESRKFSSVHSSHFEVHASKKGSKFFAKNKYNCK